MSKTVTIRFNDKELEAIEELVKQDFAGASLGRVVKWAVMNYMMSLDHLHLHRQHAFRMVQDGFIDAMESNVTAFRNLMKVMRNDPGNLENLTSEDIKSQFK